MGRGTGALIPEIAGWWHAGVEFPYPSIQSRVMLPWREACLPFILQLAMVVSAAEKPAVHSVFRSSDGGVSWIRSDAGLPGTSRINALVSFDGNVLAGTDSGVWLSMNSGRVWTTTTSASAAGRIITFAAGRDALFAAAERKGLLVSLDRGHTWNSIQPASGQGPQKVRSLYSHAGTLYAGTDGQGVFQSLDQGQSWSQLDQGLPAGGQIFAMTAASNSLFAALYSRGLYQWSNEGKSWIKVGNVRPLDVCAIEGTLVAGHNPGGLYWSEDFGNWWTHVNNPEANFDFGVSASELPPTAPVWEVEAGAGRVFAGAADGIYYSTNKGHTWIRARTGLPAESPGVSFLLTQEFILAGTIIKDR